MYPENCFKNAKARGSERVKWVLANLMLGVTLQWNSITSKRGVEVLPIASCYRFLPKLSPDGHLVSYANLTYELIGKGNLLGKKVLKISKNDLKTRNMER